MLPRIGSSDLEQIAVRFPIHSNLTARQFAELHHLSSSDSALLPLFLHYTFGRFQSDVITYKHFSESADLRQPHAWYPLTRMIKRTIVYHSGPTNSGKTHEAMQRLKAAKSGMYCAPLRLLALEIYERLNDEGTICNLLTGQERQESPLATHLSCTMEMAFLSRDVEIAVLDEIQMIGDAERGSAWTKALQGIRATEIHVCGDSSAISLVEKLCAIQGDTFSLRTYERLSPLKPSQKPLRSFKNVRRGDCVVAFSRRNIYDIKEMIERSTRLRCCVIYGNLPPSVRSEQARLFNNPHSGYDVLVASDAVGMGLNLNIGRVVFSAMEKFNGLEVGPLTASQIKQIAGRAGRYGSMFSQGEVTTLEEDDLPTLHRALVHQTTSLERAGLFPDLPQLEVFARRSPTMTFSRLLDKFAEHCKTDDLYFLCRYDDMKRVADILESIDLGFRDRFLFTLAPVSNEEFVISKLAAYASDVAQGEHATLRLSTDDKWREEPLRSMELKAMVVDLYLWLRWAYSLSCCLLMITLPN